MAGDQEATVETLKRLHAAFNRHDIDEILTFFAEDCSMDLPRGPAPWGTRYVGKGAVREGIAARCAGLPNAHYGEARHWVCGNRGISEWTLTGTTPTGKRIEVRGCDLWEFRNAQIVRKDSYWKIVE